MAADFRDELPSANDDLSLQKDFIRYVEDRMTDNEIQQFSEQLSADRSKRIAFVRFMRQQVQIKELLSESSCDEVLGTNLELDDQEISESSGASNESVSESANAVTKSPTIETLDSPLQSDQQPSQANFSWGTFRNGMTYSLFALMVLATVAGVWMSQKNAPDVVVTEIKDTHPISPEKSETKDDSSAVAGAASGKSDLQVDATTIRVALPNIGYASIQTPAEFKMITPKLARLTKGRVNIHVTESTGADFVIETPHGNIKNLGAKCDLNVDSDEGAGLLVRHGSASLEIPHSDHGSQWTFVKHISQGEGITFGKGGEINRVMSVVKSGPTTYFTPDEILSHPKLVIRGVSDTLKSSDTSKFYEIIPGGFKEDAAGCVDRTEAEWNGVDEKGLPPYLVGADYIRNFGDDAKERNLEISVTLGMPAKLYVFYDENLPSPEWLKKGFRKTGDRVGADAGRYRYSNGKIRDAKLGVGPGVSIDCTYFVWEKVVEEPGIVTLGAVQTVVQGKRAIRTMYGIAAVALDHPKDAKN